ncbi:putative inorganic carbon transporter subunit DabA [Alicyclobacillus mali (ex Roth et al. 2021)]|uniref:putative inorganic carbon transporter subunit DabA n=1 Tax=Alicyclobacillus mali (ex Roth et al. 2021) TaxID=1123961 RepID=UPI001A8EFB71
MTRSRLAPAGTTWTASSAVSAARLALDVTAVQWPISVFIARHPWPALEDLPFAAAMRKLQALGGAHLYPSMRLLRDALHRGEIDPNRLRHRMDQYLEDDVPAHLRRAFASVQEALTHEAGDPSDASPEAMALAAKAAAVPDLPDEALHFPLPSDGERARVDALSIRYLKLFVDRGQAAWSMPLHREGLFRAARALAGRDPSLSRAEKRRLGELPDGPDEVLAFGLERFDVSPRFAADYFRVHYLRLPGFVGALRFLGREQGLEDRWMLDYLAMRIMMEWALAGDAGRTFLPHPDLAGLATSAARLLEAARGPASVDLLLLAHRYRVADRYAVWLDAWEETYEASVVGHGLARPRGNTVPQAQFLFCIDVRSEPLRRHLEAEGLYETFGCAGFFNLPVWTRSLDSSYAHPSCPAIVRPMAEVREEAVDEADLAQSRRLMGAWRTLAQSFKKVKQSGAASLALPELSGPWLALDAVARTVPPLRAFAARVARASLPQAETRLALDRREGPADVPMGLSSEEMAKFAADLIRSIGLTRFAPLVVVCGHEARVENNAHRAALDCGACGGRSGRTNARALAAVLNRADVRRRLAAEHGIFIPESTRFLAAVHVTTTDEIEWLDVPPLVGEARVRFEALSAAVRRAGEKAAAERAQALPGAKRARPTLEVRRRASDWAEVRPEWGLARNRAFWIGRLALDSGPVAGEAFLHSYDWRLDPDIRGLKSIVAGPVTVAQWINLQYYASTVAPHVHGAGSKPTQTATSGIGVMQGNASDLLPGLPWQSVASDDAHLYHRPIRLLVIIEAPRRMVERLLREDEGFRRKVENGWLRLLIFDPERGAWARGEALIRTPVRR